MLQGGLPCAGCSTSCGDYTAASGTITEGYSWGSGCQWKIAPPGATQIVLTFTSLNVDSCCDFVRVYQCVSTSCQNAQAIAELSGVYSSAQTIISTTGYMLVQYTSDFLGNSWGFSVTWRLTGIPLSPSLALANVSCPIFSRIILVASLHVPGGAAWSVKACHLIYRMLQ